MFLHQAHWRHLRQHLNQIYRMCYFYVYFKSVPVFVFCVSVCIIFVPTDPGIPGAAQAPGVQPDIRFACYSHLHKLVFRSAPVSITPASSESLLACYSHLHTLVVLACFNHTNSHLCSYNSLLLTPT